MYFNFFRNFSYFTLNNEMKYFYVLFSNKKQTVLGNPSVGLSSPYSPDRALNSCFVPCRRVWPHSVIQKRSSCSRTLISCCLSPTPCLRNVLGQYLEDGGTPVTEERKN